MTSRATALALVLATGALAAAGCTAPGGPNGVTDWNWRPDAGVSGDGGPADKVTGTGSSLTCLPATGAQAMPARDIVMSASGPSGDSKVYTEDLFNLFKGTCGGCHVAASLGNFHVTAGTFAQVVDQKVLSVIVTDDPAKVMPPAGAGGAAYSSRTALDPIVQLATLMGHWLAQGRPDGLFTVPGGNSSGPSDSYTLSPQVGMQLTNIGDCIPSQAMVGSSEETIDRLDEFFATATALPGTLAETDLTTLDGAALAELRVIAFAPEYPLWSDDAGKLRHVRVPRGKSIKFDAQTQSFDIPPNTRFYKTFLKKVVDADGSERYRKIETRIILSRPDKALPDGTAVPQALFGTYMWSDDEMSATLSNITLNDHTGFTDRLIEYTVDEPRAQEIIDSKPANLKFALDVPGIKRHYAVPGSERCVQCHMGSPMANFVLGFLPVQIARRQDGAPGSYEPTGPDEMTQMQRFIDYGVVTGMASPNEVLPLEGSQGSRKPRNDQELAAQAYMVGNCAHCHNPRGFPTVKSPDLKEALNLLPGKDGGVFQFPLERMSPLRGRGIDHDVPIPYITPSLREYPVGERGEFGDNWTPKWVECNNVTDVNNPLYSPLVRFFCPRRSKGVGHLAAPWRSLIYRNVDTPFMYADDFVIFPRMPMHTSGYDCRVPRLMGDWMVSIPSARKNPEIDEDAVPLAGVAVPYDTNAQPYREVLPTDPGYAQAVADAKKRLDEYHASARYTFCPDTSDITDPAVVRAGGGLPLVPATETIYDAVDRTKIVQPDVGVPARAHYVVTDLTEPLGDWYPRRTKWNEVVVKGEVELTDLPIDLDQRELELHARQNVLEALKSATLTAELKAFVTTEVPFGTWQPKAGCDFSKVPKVSDFTGDSRPRWMSTAPALSPSAPVYMQSPASAVFNNICVNCHGPRGDSNGLLADALSNMTGGTGRVANFRKGLFGPEANPGGNRAQTFGPFATASVTAEDWAARYMAWMALGGTLVRIPEALLNIVATTRVVGVQRSPKLPVTASPNMLRLAQGLCLQALLPSESGAGAKLDDYFFRHGTFDWTATTGLIDVNGDAQMWSRLCGIGNRTVVRVPFVRDWSDVKPEINPVFSLYYADGYPADAPVLDDRGRVVSGVRSDNTFPVCFPRPAGASQQAAAEQYLAAHLVGGPGGVRIPYCPEAWLKDPKSPLETVMNTMVTGGYELTDANRWAARGAVNAGFAVFTHLQQLVGGQVTTKPDYNRCEQLPK